jgi:hypothetical protein
MMKCQLKYLTKIQTSNQTNLNYAFITADLPAEYVN